MSYGTGWREEIAECASFALGPHGCHLKGRCSWPGDKLLGDSDDGYRTYYKAACPESAPEGLPSGEEVHKPTLCVTCACDM